MARILTLALLLAGLLPAAARADDGVLDASFGTGGAVTQSLHTNLGTPDGAGLHRLVMQPDGKLVATGFARFGAESRIVMARYTSNGVPDTSFAGGLFMSDIPGYSRDVAEDVMVLPDGRIEVAGTVFAPDRSDIALARFTPAGAPDQLLDGIGYHVDRDYQDSSGGQVVAAHANAATLQPPTNIVAVGGSRFTSPTPLELVAGFRLNGSAISHLTFEAEPTSEAEDVILDPDGRFTVAGYATRPGGLDVFRADRFRADGVDSPTFGGTFADTEVAFPGASGARALALARQSDGRYVLAGFANVNGQKRLALARVNANGGLDTSFGQGGTVTAPFTSSADDVLVQPDGAIVVAGSANLGAGAEVLVERYLPDGSVDRSFGGDGIVLTVLAGSSLDTAEGIMRLPDGRLVVVGTDRSSSGENRYLMLRYGSAPACSALLGCATVRLVTKTTAIITTDLTKAIGVGIIIHRIIGHKRVPVGRVPFGTQRAGARPIKWNLKVGGHRLPRGIYEINVRALRNGKVVVISAPIRITLR